MEWEPGPTWKEEGEDSRIIVYSPHGRLPSFKPRISYLAGHIVPITLPNKRTGPIRREIDRSAELLRHTKVLDMRDFFNVKGWVFKAVGQLDMVRVFTEFTPTGKPVTGLCPDSPATFDFQANTIVLVPLINHTMCADCAEWDWHAVQVQIPAGTRKVVSNLTIRTNGNQVHGFHIPIDMANLPTSVEEIVYFLPSEYTSEGTRAVSTSTNLN
jgi:hypothetical protein